MPRLTDQEKQEIIRFLEADKVLPDKYRFLLFEEKREVELVWNGKTNEVSNIVLPFQVIEQVDEPRAEKDKRLQMMLFDLERDAGEQHDVGPQNPEVVRRLRAYFDRLNAEVPAPVPRTPAFRGIKRLKGGELRYDLEPAPPPG